MGTVALVAAFAFALAWTVRAGWADSQFQMQTVSGTMRAIQLVPGEASYWVRFALLVSDDDPAGSIEALKRAVTLNPLDANAWIELGLRFEANRDLASAERSLLRAASADNGYLPRWSLANYYFRRGNSQSNDVEKFWRWARSAAAMAYGDPSPLFRLCWSFTSDGREIEDRLGLDRPGLEAGYLFYLLDQRRIAFAARAAGRLAEWNRESDTPLLLEACDRLLDDKQSEEAVALWNRLSQLHRIPYSPLIPQAGAALTNASFGNPPLSRGFDWHLPQVEGISAALEESPPGIRISFTGRQPESCQLLSQVVPVAERTRYTLTFLYRTDRVAPGSGLSWRVLDGNAVLARSDSLSSDHASPGGFSFTTPARCRLMRLVLAYERAPGTTRIEGSIAIRGVSLERR